MISAPQQKQVTIGSHNYILKPFNALFGLKMMNEIQKAMSKAKGETEGEGSGVQGYDFSPEQIKEAIVAGVESVDNSAFTAAKFDKHFVRKYKDIYELFGAVLAFNFDGMDGESDPNE